MTWVIAMPRRSVSASGEPYPETDSRVHHLLVDGGLGHLIAVGWNWCLLALWWSPARQVGEHCSPCVREADEPVLIWLSEPEVQGVGEQPPVEGRRAGCGLQASQLAPKRPDAHCEFLTLLGALVVMQMLEPAPMHRVLRHGCAHPVERLRKLASQGGQPAGGGVPREARQQYLLILKQRVRPVPCARSRQQPVAMVGRCVLLDGQVPAHSQVYQRRSDITDDHSSDRDHTKLTRPQPARWHWDYWHRPNVSCPKALVGRGGPDEPGEPAG
jgi:hypothetical protein